MGSVIVKTGVAIGISAIAYSLTDSFVHPDSHFLAGSINGVVIMAALLLLDLAGGRS